MGSPITRSPSIALIEDSFASFGKHAPDARKACEKRVTEHLSAPHSPTETEVLSRGRRLFDLARHVPAMALASPQGAPQPAAGSAHEGSTPPAPQLPVALPDARDYFPIAREIVELIVRGVDARSPTFQQARAATQLADADGAIASLVAGVLAPLLGTLAHCQVDTSNMRTELQAALGDCFLAEDMTFKYALNLTPATLQVLASDQAGVFQQGSKQMQAALTEGMPAVLQKIQATAAQPLADLSPQDQAKHDRMAAWFRDMQPEFFATAAPTAKDGPQERQIKEFTLREVILLLANAMANVDLDELAEFHRSPAGLELKAKQAALALDQESDLVQAQMQQVLQPYLEAMQQAQTQSQVEEIAALMEQMGLPFPESPEARAAFIEQVQRMTPMMFGQPDQT